MKLFYRLTPYSRLSSNPLFDVEVRHLQHGSSDQSMTNANLSCGLVVFALSLLLWLLLVLSNSPSIRSTAGIEFAFILGGLSLLASFVLDFSSVSNAFISTSGDLTSGQWELLRLTMITPKQIVTARHGLAQVRTWRWLTVIVATRIAVALMFILSFLLLLPQHVRMLPLATFDIVSTFIAQLVIVSAALFFVAEPFWRMRTFTALGVAASVRARQQFSSILISLGVIGLFWLAQGIVISALALGINFLLVPLAQAESSMNRLVIFSPLLLLVILIAVIYGFYSVIQRFALRRAERFAARWD